MKKPICLSFLILAFCSQSAWAFGDAPADATAEQEAALPDPRQDPARCHQNFCIDDDVIINGTAARIEAYNQGSGTFAIRWESGGLSSSRYAPSQMAQTRSGTCHASLCVGNFVIVRGTPGRIVGIYPGGDFAIRWSSGTLSSTKYTADNIANTRIGLCHLNVCVGDEGAISGTRMTVVGLYPSGEFAIQWESGGYSSSTYEASDIAIRKTTAQAQAERQRAAEWNEAQSMAQEGKLDLGIYGELRKNGAPHAEALDKAMGPVWISMAQTERFLNKLGNHVYQFDRLYLLEIAKLLAPGDHLERRRQFIGAAMLPFLRNFGYKAVKERYLNPSIQAIEKECASQGVKSLLDIESTALMRRLSVYMLAASLQTSMPQLNAAQKAEATEILRVLAESATKGMKYRDMQVLFALIPGYRSLLLELSQNLYLQARVAVDMQLLDYLENS